MDQKRRGRIPEGLSILMWPALLRAPWLIGSFMDRDEDRERDEFRRRHRRRGR